MGFISRLSGKLQEKVRRFGYAGAVRYLVMRAIDVAHDYGYDLRHGVDTRGVTAPIDESGHGYKGSLPRIVRETIERSGVRYEDFTFIDLGSGKGRTLLIASEYPFRRIRGVEYVPEINAVAQANIARYRGAKRKCPDLESLCCDVRDFAFPVEPLLIYLFNPFRESLMRVVMENLERSIEEHPRPVVVIYMRPLHAGAVESTRCLEKAASHQSRLIENFNYSIYRSRVAPAARTSVVWTADEPGERVVKG